MSKTFAKIGAIAVGATFALSLSVSTAGAVTVAELQAQINALMAQLASLQGSATVSAQFTTDLTVGSTGSQVVALQQMLVAQGHLTMPAGVAYGYFGSLTKAAVAKWQAANGIAPAVGYFGPLSRAKANASATGVVPGTPVTGGTTAGGTISTPGVEGTLTATLASTPTSAKLYEGGSKVGVMGIELEAKLSDIKIERVKIKLDEASDSTTSDRDFYRKIADRLYIMDGSTVLASVDLNADTVIEESTGNYYVTVTGLNYIVRKDTKKVLTVALDAMSTWDTAFDGDSWTVSVPVEGVRGVDGAGVNQYSPSTLFSRNFTSEAEAIAAATLKISLNTSSPEEALVIASAGVDEDEKDGLELMRFDVKAEKDAVTITDLVATITRGGSGAATTTTVYLMDGSTVLDSATGNTLSVTGGTVTFDDIDYVVSKDSTRTLRIVVDVRDANATVTTYSAAVTASQVTSENSAGDGVTESGSATGETLTVLNAGPEITLGSKSITKTEIQFSGATSSAKATFNLTLKAVGDDVHFGSQSASTTFAFQTYLNGTATTLLVASSTSWSVPSGVVTSGIVSGGFILQEGNSVTIPVEFLFEGRTTAGALVSSGAYAVGLENIKWATGTAPATQITTDFMSGETDWRTSTVTMP